MQKIAFVLFLFLSKNLAFGQTKSVSHKLLTQQETEQIFPIHVKQKLGISYPINQVDKYIDKSGLSYIILSENEKDKIKAFRISENKNILTKDWEFSDFKLKNKSETAIWFWTEYTEFNDIDKDGLIDPIIIYGTEGINLTEDGRIKILIYYKNKKVAIRHQNGILDHERNTKVDKEFYSLPAEVQKRVKDIMHKVIEDEKAIFPYNWEEAMKKRKLYFDEY